MVYRIASGPHFTLSLSSLQALPVCQLGLPKPFLSPGDFRCSEALVRVQQPQMLRGLTVLELCLLVAMLHVTEATEEECFNFEMVYNGACCCCCCCHCSYSLVVV